MKKKALFLKLLLRDIKQNLGRYFAILLIIALGVGFYAGISICREQMVATGDRYLDEHNMYDFMLASTMGLDSQGLELISAEGCATAAEGSVTADVIVTGSDDAEQVLKAMQITPTINTPSLVAGRLPQTANECLVDSELYSEAAIGEKLTISTTNDEDTRGYFSQSEYTIVGLARSVNYMNFQRGNTSLGNGKLAGFFYIPTDGFDSDYFTEIYLTVDADGEIYSDEYDDAIEAVRAEIEALAEAAADARYRAIIDEINRQLDDARSEYNQGVADYQAEKQTVEQTFADTLARLNDAKRAIDNGEAELLANETSLKQAYGAGLIDEATYTASMAQIAASRAALEASRAEWQAGMDGYEEGKQEAEEGFAEAEATLADALAEIEQAEADRDAIEKPEAYALSRSESNMGYASFNNDTNIVEGIAKVFPVFFFLVAALVCMTTMTRLVKEQRTQIGVWKALGYSDGKILSKYMLYAGSAAAIGCVGGFIAGTIIFPQVIWIAYDMMYGFAELEYVFSLPLALVSLIVSIVCSVGTVWLVCRKELSQMPAQAIRPVAPKAGKRIFLEYIPFLWKRLSFLVKVSLRNVFRYRNRLFMMLLGIGGCTALLVAGLGLQDSVKGIATDQFEMISIYDAEITLSDAFEGDESDAFLSTYSNGIDNAYFAHKSSVTLVTDDEVKDTNLIVTDGSDISDFWLLSDDGTALTLPKKGEALINRKLSERYDLEAGDTLTLRDERLKEITVRISGVFDNYIDSYVFLSTETHEEGWGKTPEFTTVFVNFSEGVDSHELSAQIGSDEAVSRVSVNADMLESLNQTLKSMDYVVLLVIFCAGLLAFIVLFNLTNINITERVREIATIKVLGFHRSESAAYVFRESFMLTGISALIGLPFGKALHSFVMAQIDVDMICFNVQVDPMSYLTAFLLTMLFAVIVNLAIYGTIEQINMAESLKSVE